MILNEIFLRTAVKNIGYVSVRYPEVGCKYADKYYRELADRFTIYAVKNSLVGMLNCTVAYEDPEYASVITEARLYKDGNCVRRHRSSFVWDRVKGRLRYIRKGGIRRSNISYNGTELSIFD